MTQTGILIHVHHLETVGWEELVWGDPINDRFGSLAMLVYLLLTAPPQAPVSTIVMGCGPSFREGLSEFEYTKRFMLDHLDQLTQFPRLRPLLEALSVEDKNRLRSQIEGVLSTDPIRGTTEEVRTAAAIFKEHDAGTIYEVSSASHAPRCMQIQAKARAEGAIPASQLWFLTPTEMCFWGAKPDDTVVFEPPHRGDDLRAHGKHTLSQALKPAIYMSYELQQQLTDLVYDFTLQHIEHANERLREASASPSRSTSDTQTTTR